LRSRRTATVASSTSVKDRQRLIVILEKNEMSDETQGEGRHEISQNANHETHHRAAHAVRCCRTPQRGLAWRSRSARRIVERSRVCRVRAEEKLPGDVRAHLSQSCSGSWSRLLLCSPFLHQLTKRGDFDGRRECCRTPSARSGPTPPHHRQKRVVRSVSHCGETATSIVSIALSRPVSTNTPVKTRRTPSIAFAVWLADASR
jgi:ribosomal protein L34E